MSIITYGGSCCVSRYSNRLCETGLLCTTRQCPSFLPSLALLFLFIIHFPQNQAVYFTCFCLCSDQTNAFSLLYHAFRVQNASVLFAYHACIMPNSTNQCLVTPFLSFFTHSPLSSLLTFFLYYHSHSHTHPTSFLTASSPPPVACARFPTSGCTTSRGQGLRTCLLGVPFPES